MNDRFGSWVRTVLDWNVWTWLAAIYLALVLGSLFVMLMLAIGVTPMKVPLAILALGGVSCLLIGRSKGASEVGPWLRAIPSFFYLSFIFAMSSKSFLDVKPSFDVDYFHPLEYSFLGVFLSWFWVPSLLRGKISSFSAKVVASGVLFGISDELHQWFVPGRTCSLFDLMLDFIGVAIGMGIVLLARSIHCRLRRQFARQD